MPMKIVDMEPMDITNHPTPLNPFLQDAYHMGERLGNNAAVMFSNHPFRYCPYLIVIDLETGERKKIEFGRDNADGSSLPRT